MGQSGGCSKQNTHRGSKHKDYYSNLTAKVAKRKDRRVAKSSHGKFKTVAELVNATSPKPSPQRRVDKASVPKDQWTRNVPAYIPPDNRGNY